MAEVSLNLRPLSNKYDMKLYNTPVTLKMVKKFITKLDFSKVSRYDFIPVGFLRTFNLNLHTN